MAFSKISEFDQREIDLARYSKALAHPARIAILKLLQTKNGCICNSIVEELPLSQSTVSQHLKELKEAGLITGEVDGPRVCYCLNLKACKVAMNTINALFNKICNLKIK